MERMKQGNGNSSIQNTLYSLFDEYEINLAKILLQLPDLIVESDSRHRFSLNWGAKRRRSAINLSPSPPPLRTIPPPPTPTPTPPIIWSFVGEDGERRLIRKMEITSPATPLSFSPSESEDKSKRVSTKISKRRRKREDLLEMIAELTQRKELLQGEVEIVRLHYNQLKALNLELKAKKAELNCGEKVVPCMEINKRLDLKMEFPKPIVKSVLKIEDMENQHASSSSSSTIVYNQPLIINQTVRKTETCEKLQHPTCSRLTHLWSSSNGEVGIVKVSNRGPLGIIPDLNVSIEDGSSGMDSLQPFDFRGALVNTTELNKAAMAAEARKKRRQIYKVKNSIAANKPRYGHR